MKDLKLYFKLNALPEDVYNALTNRIMIEIWTGEKAEFEAVPNTEFSIWEGAITGKNIEFVMNEKIVQVWYFDDVESEVTIKLHPDKKNTKMEVVQKNIPDEAFDNMKDGWEGDIFGSLADLFNE